MNDTWLSLPTTRTLLEELVESITKQYRVEPARAEELLKQSLAKNDPLRELVEADNTVKQIQRTRIYKNAAANAKREVYYALRRYHEQDADVNELIEQLSRLPANDSRISGLLERICNTHVSTRERQPHAKDFYRCILEQLQQPKSIIDVGCGMHPLQFPFPLAPPSLGEYLAMDSDDVSIRAVETFAIHQQRVKLIAIHHDLEDGWDDVLNKHGGERFDVALMFKLVAVIQRHDRRLLSTLAETPAAMWLISGSKRSMTKRRDISRRERAIVRQFVDDAGRNIKSEFEVGEEFVVVVE